MYIEIEGCIYPKCNGGITCPLNTPPSRCDLDLSEDDKLNIEDYKIVLAGREALKRIQKRKNKERSRIFYQEHKEERRIYQREWYRRKKENKK